MRILLLALAFALPTVGQEMSTRSLGFHVSSFGGYALDGSARGVQGLDYSAGASVSVPDGVAVLHRLILDRSHNLYFGYDMTARVREDGRLQLHFSPLSDLSGFRADFASFKRGDLELPQDRAVSLNESLEVPLEATVRAPPMLIDTLRFSEPR